MGRFGDVTAWWETGDEGGGVTLTQVVQLLRSVASGALAPGQVGARIAGVLTTGDPTAVPALVVAVPVPTGLQVVVHGWGAVVADELRIPNGWIDEVVTGRTAWWIGRNTATPQAPVIGAPVELLDGVVPGDGAGIALYDAPAPEPEPMPEPEAPAFVPGHIVLDDGRAVQVTGTTIIGTDPGEARAVRIGMAEGLALSSPDGTVRPVHAELRLLPDRIVLVDATNGATHVLAPGAAAWEPAENGALLPLLPGTRVALGSRTFSYLDGPVPST